MILESTVIESKAWAHGEKFAFKESPPNVFIGGPVRKRVDSRLKHAGMTDFGSAIRLARANSQLNGKAATMRWRQCDVTAKRDSKSCAAILFKFLVSCVVMLATLRSPALAQTKIVQAIPTKSFGYLPLFVAQESGFYGEESLEVIAPVVRSAVAVPGLLSGEIHFASAESGMRVAMRGTPVKAIIFYYDRATWIFMGRPEIRSIRDLNGKNIAINSLGAGADFTTREILRANGLQEKNYNLIALGQDSQRILALVKNQVQATLLNPDTAAVAETQIEGIKRLAHSGDVQKTPFSGFVFQLPQ